MAPTSTPRVGWLAISTESGRDSSRASTTFCWFPPDSAETVLSMDWVRMSNSPTRVLRVAARMAFRSRATPRAYGGSSKWFSTRFSATVKVPTNPSCLRSSGTKPRPSPMVCFGLAPVIDLPSSVTVPRVSGITPSSASASSVCPLPWTPAMQTISPPVHLQIAPVDDERARRAGDADVGQHQPRLGRWVPPPPCRPAG